jgi:hypothetical protein
MPAAANISEPKTLTRTKNLFAGFAFMAFFSKCKHEDATGHSKRSARAGISRTTIPQI